MKPKFILCLALVLGGALMYAAFVLIYEPSRLLARAKRCDNSVDRRQSDWSR